MLELLFAGVYRSTAWLGRVSGRVLTRSFETSRQRSQMRLMSEIDYVGMYATCLDVIKKQLGEGEGVSS